MSKEGTSTIEINNEDPNSFESQFAHKEKFELLGGVIEFVDVKPEHPKTEVPVLFAPGWGETPEALKDVVRIMAERGRRVITLSHARRGMDMKDADPSMKKEYPEAQLRKALALIQVLAEKGIEKTDVVAHSEGGINAAIAAALETEKFRNIVFMNVGGLIGKDKFPKLAGRFALSAIKDALNLVQKPDATKQARMNRITREVAKYIAKNPIRALREAVDISESQIHGLLRGLHEKGVGIAVINGVDDPVFPMEKMQQMVKQDQLDGFLSVKGGHPEIILNPEQYIPAADVLLDRLEEKRLSALPINT